MSSYNSTALTKRSAAGALMPPPPAPKRIKRPSIVLDEDTYVSAISHIIRRDFFPGLAEADAQREYLNALESKDKSWIRESGKKLTQVMTPVLHDRRRAADRTRFDRPSASVTNKTPTVWGTDTPITVANLETDDKEDSEGLGELDKVDLDMSLNAFQAKYTSEDQESFSAIIDKQNLKRFEKNPWIHDGNRYASKQRIAQQKVIEGRSSSSQALTLRPSQNLDDRPAAPTMHKHTAFNTLMFAPDSVESWAPTNQNRAEEASLAPPKQTRYLNTRLPAETELPQRPTSPTLSAIRDAVSGKPRLGMSEGGYAGSETPRVNGYAFVDAHPPSPGSDDDGDAPEDLLERFGVSSTSSATQFNMTEASEREKMHHKMVDAIGAKRAAGAGNKTGPVGNGLGIFASETPRFLSAPTPVTRLAGQTPGRKAKGGLTPAGQRLFERMGKTPRGTSTGGFSGDNGKRQDWTPNLRMKRKP